MRRIYNYINGKLVKPSSNLYIDVFNPATGKVYTKAPDSNEKDVKKAIKAAHEAFDEWSSMSINARSRYLIKIADLIYENREYLAKAESKDNGKPLWLAKAVDIPRASSNFRFFGQAITQFASESHETNQDVINYTLRRPLGVVSCISPWNLPLYLFTWKIAPALAAGNTVVAKPSEITPMTAFLLAEICKEAKLPKGVLNIIHGYGHKVGPAMTTHPKVKAVSFTGSTKTGAEIARNTAPLFKKLSLEMGGKNPNIIFADCDYDKMLATTIRSSFANQGQICLCGSRIYVEKKIYNKFKKDFVARAKKLKVGDPSSSKSNLGAVVSKEHYEKILSYIDLAKEEGGDILCGGKASIKGVFKNGYYVKPTIIEGLSPTCRTNQEEIFGPVVTLVPFTKQDEVIGYANDISYGLSATIWTENLSKAHFLAGKIEAGIVWINTWLLRDLRTPFGGIKNSGVGREGGFEAFRFFTEPKNVCIDFSHHPD